MDRIIVASRGRNPFNPGNRTTKIKGDVRTDVGIFRADK